MREATDQRPSTGSELTGAVVYLFWKNEEAEIFLDTSGETLAKHGYRKLPGKAPMLEALAAAKALKQYMGISVDLLDMRTVRPLDIPAVIASVEKTGRLLVADTAFKTGSVAGELISQIAETAFGALKKAPVRIASPDHPVPTSPFMSADYYPGPRQIAEAIIDMVGADRQTNGYVLLGDSLKSSNRHDVPNRDFSGPF
jgi:pyruvate dehydrogenase E1 component beta subunit